ncbi:MAG TPA: transglutaminase-like domain-containing protein [Dehalococcoidia bacterium]|jgi:hypothetical protein
MVTESGVLSFYTQPAQMTCAGSHAAAFAALPREIGGLARVAQGLYLHEHMTESYGVVLPDERRGEVHIRENARRLDYLLARDGRPLDEARPAGQRLIANCRHYTVLLVAVLRSRGVPARARCGFAGYFAPGHFVDHWVGEYWDVASRRWVLVDAQIDDVQRAMFKPEFDLLDVPRDRFLIAADAWSRCRVGDADPQTFGILDMAGLWFIAGNLIRDVAALNNMEMLPWDVWGAMPRADEPLAAEQLAYFDHLAALTHEPDAAFAELRSLYQSDDRLRVPATVFNAVLNRTEAV